FTSVISLFFSNTSISHSHPATLPYTHTHSTYYIITQHTHTTYPTGPHRTLPHPTMATVWDNVVASASKAMTHAGTATQTAATKAKLHADILLIDRDMQSRKEKFGVDLYAHLENITSTQEFYVSDDRLINILRPVLIKAQREVAAYERKRDAMKGKVNAAETDRVGSASIFGAETIGQKLYNAARFAQAGAREAAFKTELAMVERQILGFKEEFGAEMYPVFQSMEDNEGWLPTDRKVRSLYDAAREDIAAMEKAKAEKARQIEELDQVGGGTGTGTGTGFAPPPAHGSAAVSTAPAVVATPVSAGNGYHAGTHQTAWASAAPVGSPSTASYGVSSTSSSSYGTQQITGTGSYGSTAQPPAHHDPYAGTEMNTLQTKQTNSHEISGFGFMQTQPNANLQTAPTQGITSNDGMTSSYSNGSFQQLPPQQQPQQQPSPQQPQQSFNSASVFDPFDGIASANSSSNAYAASNAYGGATANSTGYGSAAAPSSGSNVFDPFSSGNQGSGSSSRLSEADMNLFKY
ncbi:hypothetical protein ACHAXS_003412, partial [Conticribra weissflogii]